VTSTDTNWDLVVVGAGPAGSAAALGALTAAPQLRVLVVDAATFPRDKACGDGIAPHVLDRLASVGVRGLLDDWAPVEHLSLSHGRSTVARRLRRPVWVVPREVFDARLVEAATAAGARLTRHRVRKVRADGDAVVLDDALHASVVVGADGAHSTVRAAAGLRPGGRRALAIRGYSPTPAIRRGRQVMVYGGRRQPSYAWSFDRGDGLANVGYGELLDPARDTPSRQLLLEELERLLPGATASGTAWRGHHLPLSSWRWAQPDGRLLLAGDAASLINPMTGEGIYYAVTTGILAGRAAAAAVETAQPARAGGCYRRSVRSTLARHLVHTALASRLVEQPLLVEAGVRAAARDQRVFDDLVEVGLARGRITAAIVRGVAGALLPDLRVHDPSRQG